MRWVRRSGLLAAGLGAVAMVGGLARHAALAQNAPLTRAPDGRPLVLSFSDDFDSLRRIRRGAPVAGAVWRTTFGDGSKNDIDARTIRNNKELELYVDPEMTDSEGRLVGVTPFEVHDGVLDLIARPTPEALRSKLGGYGYLSGMISSQPALAQTYGYFEARVKLPAGKGLWPAVWMLPSDLSWPPEIDIMESIGNPMTAFMTVHSATVKPQGLEVHPSSTGFHTYAVEWDAQQVIFYLDGVETQRSPTPADMHKPMYILANLALGGDWAGAPDGATRFPAKFSIDYIRAYRFAK